MALCVGVGGRPEILCDVDSCGCVVGKGCVDCRGCAGVGRGIAVGLWAWKG